MNANPGGNIELSTTLSTLRWTRLKSTRFLLMMLALIPSRMALFLKTSILTSPRVLLKERTTSDKIHKLRVWTRVHYLKITLIYYYDNFNEIGHRRLGRPQSNLVLVTGIILLIPFNNFSEISSYISSSPS